MINPELLKLIDWSTVKDFALLLGPIVTFFVGRKKGQSELNKITADTGKIDVETFINMRRELKDLQKTVTELLEKDQQKTEQIGLLKHEHKSCHVILGQVEKNQRIFFDELGIAYWEADKDGNCTYANQTFLDLTGLTTDKCLQAGWLDGIHAADKAKIQYQWRNFVANTETQVDFKFRFHHCETGIETEVSAHGQAIYINGYEIHKYTARTRQSVR